MGGLACAKCRRPMEASEAVRVSAQGQPRKRPVCPECHEAAVRGVGRGGAHVQRSWQHQTRLGDPDPGFENAVRRVEGD